MLENSVKKYNSWLISINKDDKRQKYKKLFETSYKDLLIHENWLVFTYSAENKMQIQDTYLLNENNLLLKKIPFRNLQNIFGSSSL